MHDVHLAARMPEAFLKPLWLIIECTGIIYLIGGCFMKNKKLLEEIRSYWNNRADGYSRVNQEELHSEQK